MKRTQNKKPMSMDVEHMRMLHTEAIEQLDLMYTTLEAAEQATDSNRDVLDDISVNHWDAYIDIIHIISMHDEAMDASIKKYSLQAGESQDVGEERQLSLQRGFVIYLLLALLRRHHRIEYILTLRSNPMADYFQESLTMEREHIAHLITMTQKLI